MVHKLDRLTRSLIDFIGLLDWCKAQGKTVISVSESLDFSTAHGRMFAQLLAMFAEFERSRISAAVTPPATSNGRPPTCSWPTPTSCR